MTLLELVVAAALSVVVLGLLVGHLIPVARASSRGGLRVEMLQQAVTALNRLIMDAKTTSPTGLSLRTPDPLVIAINPVDKVQPDGVLAWQRDLFIIYRWDRAGQRLLRSLWTGQTTEEVSASRAKHLSVARLSEVVTNGPLREEVVVASRVVDFKIVQDGTDEAVRPPVRFEITLEDKANTGKSTLERLTYTRSLYLRNQR